MLSLGFKSYCDALSQKKNKSLIVMRNKEFISWPSKLDLRDSMQNNQKITCPFELESRFKFKRKYK